MKTEGVGHLLEKEKSSSGQVAMKEKLPCSEKAGTGRYNHTASMCSRLHLPVHRLSKHGPLSPTLLFSL